MKRTSVFYCCVGEQDNPPRFKARIALWMMDASARLFGRALIRHSCGCWRWVKCGRVSWIPGKTVVL